MLEPEPTAKPEVAAAGTITETSKPQSTAESQSVHESTPGITQETEGERFSAAEISAKGIQMLSAQKFYSLCVCSMGFSQLRRKSQTFSINLTKQ